MIIKGQNFTGQISLVSGSYFCNRLHLNVSFKEFSSFTDLSRRAHMDKNKHVLKMSWNQVSLTLPYFAQNRHPERFANVHKQGSVMVFINLSFLIEFWGKKCKSCTQDKHLCDIVRCHYCASCFPWSMTEEAQDSHWGRQPLPLLAVWCFIPPPLAGLNETQTPSSIMAKGRSAAACCI